MSEPTWLDLVREYFPTATDEQADQILWEHTGFPMDRIEAIREQLEAHRKANPDE